MLKNPFRHSVGNPRRGFRKNGIHNDNGKAGFLQKDSLAVTQQAAKELKMSPSTVWKRMQKLKNMQNCDIKSNSNYTLVSIVNWGSYQPQEQNGNSKGNSGVTTEEPPSDTNKNDKNDKNKYPVSFLEFWALYPGSVKGGKKPAFESWKKKVKAGILPSLDELSEILSTQE